MSCCFDRNCEPDPASPEALWGNARGCWEAFALLFGDALSLVGEVFIRREARNEANAFLRGLEALVRRLLLIEAIHAASAEQQRQASPTNGGLAPRAGGEQVGGPPSINSRSADQSPSCPPPLVGGTPTDKTEPSDPAAPKAQSHPAPGIPRREPNPGSGVGRKPLPHPDPGSSLHSVRDDDADHHDLDTESTARWPAHFPLRLNTLLGAHLRDEPLDVTRASHWPRRRAPRHVFVRPDDEPALPTFDLAAPLALRLEALRRVIAEPAPYIRRAANALARFQAGNSAPRLVGSPRIAGENARFFLTALNRVDASALGAVESCWPAEVNDTS